MTDISYQYFLSSDNVHEVLHHNYADKKHHQSVLSQVKISRHTQGGVSILPDLG